MKVDSETQVAKETTSLLLPSPHSTNESVSLSHAGDGFGQPLSSSNSLRHNDDESQKDKCHRLRSINVGRHRAVLLLLLACISLVCLHSLVNFNNIPSREESLALVYSRPRPFSQKHPVTDLGIQNVARPTQTAPSHQIFRLLESSASESRKPLPTSAWYQNMLQTEGEPTNLNRAYALPYILDVVGPIPGLTLHSSFLVPTSKVIQLSNNPLFGLTLGAKGDVFEDTKTKATRKYSVSSLTELGLTLHWDAMRMSSSLVRGMAYGTMIYEERQSTRSDGRIVYPTIASNIAFGKPPVADGTKQMKCDKKSDRTLVQKEVELYFGASDFSWLVFFSEPVWIQCSSANDGSDEAFLQVVDSVDEQTENPLVIRAALVDFCTNRKYPNFCNGAMSRQQKQGYSETLRRYAEIIPGQNSFMHYDIREDKNEGTLVFDWNVESMSHDKDGDFQSTLRAEGEKAPLELLHFALPHHMDNLDNRKLPNDELYCLPSLLGPACTVVGAEMSITETLPDISFRAPRPIKANFISAIGDTLIEDLQYELQSFFQRGAGDTYFSGKMLAKLGRIVLVAEELTEICSERNSREYRDACKNTTLPTKREMDNAIDNLQSSVEIWINGSAEAPFIYDDAWGGLVSCGCDFDEGTGTCKNEFPDCPALSDQGLDFGNGFYNDQHFHYGYHIYAASAVAHFRPEWGMEHWEQILLLVRSIANPSEDDNAFPLFRHKDWYQGSSWASGIPIPPYLNGKNQESSAEAIAAYEAVALFGKVMQQVWNDASMSSEASIAKEIKQVGQIMTATELRSTRRYWHVKQNDPAERIYPKEYTGLVVGILWQTMAQFGTWFGSAEYLPYGIQLLPLTSISEERDELAWINEMYYPFSTSCAAEFQCTESGWGVLQLAVLATVGYADEAAKRVGLMPDESFTNAGGNGHSRTNTLWYIATRPDVEEPVPLVESDVRGADEKRPAPVYKLTDCHTPMTCTDAVLDLVAGDFTCRERINWLIKGEKNSQWDACSSMGAEFPQICGLCDPSNESETNQAPLPTQNTTDIAESQCPPCTDDECHSQLNRCPLFDNTFVCTAGPNSWGCRSYPWDINTECEACCEMTTCQSLKDKEAKKVTKDGNLLEKPVCPHCPKSICYGKVNQCPIHTAPYLCMGGDSIGGCGSRPWDVSSCSVCCEITENC